MSENKLEKELERNEMEDNAIYFKLSVDDHFVRVLCKNEVGDHFFFFFLPFESKVFSFQEIGQFVLQKNVNQKSQSQIKGDHHFQKQSEQIMERQIREITIKIERSVWKIKIEI